MAGLFGILDVAARGLAATQSGIRVTSHNVANVETPGYTRQRQMLAAGNPIESGQGALGTGVEQIGIERVAEPLLLRQLADADARSAALDVEAGALVRIEQVWYEQAGAGLVARLSALFDAFDDLASAASPGAPVERAGVQAAATALIDAVQDADRALRALQQEADRGAVQTLGEIDSLAQEIALLNREIVRAEAFGPANDLRDRRDAVVRELARKVEISSFEEPSGALVVMVSRGLPLVDGASAHRLVAEPDPSHPFSPGFSRILFDDGTGRFDVTAEIGQGELGGWLAVRDGLAADAIRELDVLAYNLAVQVNAVHAAGVGLDGSVGGLFAAPTAVEDAARGLALEAAVAASPDAIAAGLGTDPGDNRNALALAALRHTAAALFLPGDPPGPPSGPVRTVLQHVAATVGRVGAEARSLASARDDQARALGQLENRRDAVSGVSLDEEMVRLIRLESAYQANARMVETLTRLLDSVLDMAR